MKTAQAQNASVAKAAQRRAYTAPKLTTFGDVSALTGGGSINASEGGLATPTMPMLMMRA